MNLLSTVHLHFAHKPYLFAPNNSHKQALIISVNINVLSLVDDIEIIFCEVETEILQVLFRQTSNYKGLTTRQKRSAFYPISAATIPKDPLRKLRLLSDLQNTSHPTHKPSHSTARICYTLEPALPV